jgi:hypothetical protein
LPPNETASASVFFLVMTRRDLLYSMPNFQAAVPQEVWRHLAAHSAGCFNPVAKRHWRRETEERMFVTLEIRCSSKLDG